MTSREIFENMFLPPSSRGGKLIQPGRGDAGLLRKTQAAQAAGVKMDDMGMPIGGSGMRRFATNKPGEGGGGPGSTAGILLGWSGWNKWAADERDRGNTVPDWEDGMPYGEESLTPSEVVDRLIEG